LVGERWSLLIIRNAVFAGMTRFSEFERGLGIAPNVLTTRLDGFVAEGLMELRPVDGSSGTNEYVLTDKGRELGVIVMALTQWGDRWAAPSGPPILLQHRGCGGSVRVTTHCERCGGSPEPDAIDALPGPGADDEVRRKRSRRR
jgi:DNA-binding HxlR family transcriptional regulator